MSILRSTPLRAAGIVLIGGLVLSACGSSGPAATQEPIRPATSVPAGLSGIGDLPAPASPWPTAQYDARHSSGTPATGPTTGTVRWKRSLGGQVTPGPVIGVDGSLLIATNAGILYALDPRTGVNRWTFDGGSSYGIDLSTSPSILADGTILWPGPNGTLFALDKVGTKLWTEHFGGQILTPAVAGRDRVYVSDMTGTLAAIEMTRGAHTVKWRLDVGGDNYASPSIGTNGSIYTSTGTALVAVRDLGDKGAELWRFPVKRMIEVSSAVAPDGTVVVGTNNDGEYGLHPDGTKSWSFPIKGFTYSSPSVRPDGTGSFGDNNGLVRTFDSKTGRVTQTIKPKVPKREHVWSSIVTDARGNTYWGSTEDRVYGYDASGTNLFTLPVDGAVWNYPALDAAGTLYVGTTAGTLYAIG